MNRLLPCGRMVPPIAVRPAARTCEGVADHSALDVEATLTAVGCPLSKTWVAQGGEAWGVYFGRVKEVLTRREEIKRNTLEARRRQHCQSLPMAA